MQPDPRDAEFINTVCSAVTGLMVAVHRGENLRIFGELNQLMTAIIEHNKTRPGDEALRRAVGRLSR